MERTPQVSRLPWTALERWAVALTVIFLIAFGLLMLRRTAWRWEPMTDLTCYLRAAWAQQQGLSPYQVTNEGGLHYTYPPLLSILLLPLGEPPPPQVPHATAFRGLDAGNIRLTFSVALWYALSVALIFVGVHRLAAVLENEAGPPADPALTRRRWWAWRLVPTLVCLPAIGMTLSRGQVETMLFCCIALAIVALVRRQDFRAGLWLALPICIKVFPAALLLYALWRRRWRCLAGCMAGLILGFVIIPVSAIGPQRAWAQTYEHLQCALLPGIGLGGDRAFAHELTDMNTTDNCSILHVLHNLANRGAREQMAATHGTRITALAVALWMVAMLLMASGRRRQDPDSAVAVVLFLGLATTVMLIGNSVCHRHYLVLLLPLIMGMMACENFPLARTRTGRLSAAAMIFFIILMIVGALPTLDPFFRFWGLSLVGVVLLWAVGLAALRRLSATPVSSHTS